MTILWIVLAVTILFAAISLAWRWASRIWSLPCPSVTAWRFDNPLIRALTRTTLDRLGLRPGQKILEIGPGPGRLLIPAAARVLPGELREAVNPRLLLPAEAVRHQVFP